MDGLWPVGNNRQKRVDLESMLTRDVLTGPACAAGGFLYIPNRSLELPSSNQISHKQTLVAIVRSTFRTSVVSRH